MEGQLVKILLKCTVATLARLAVICGAPAPAAIKDVRIKWFVNNYKFYVDNFNTHSPQKSVLGIDVGVKNFSYCRSIGSSFPIKITEWAKLDLNEKFGKNYQPLIDKETMIDTKRYFQFITKALVDELQPKQSDVVVMEAQRTRSHGNSSTLPSVLLCYNLENLIVSNAYPKIIIPMTAHQMTNYWIHRFVATKAVKNATKNQKAIRFELLKSWKDKLYKLPGYGDEELEKKNVLEYLKLDKGEKIDDLMDSLLYNLTITSQFQNLKDFHDLVSTDVEKSDIQGFVDVKDQYHLELIKPVVEKYKLTLK